ncbi:MAG: xanthine dehydrogenase family protein subunit M [Acetobacteraceae bacterium]|nr:xanthine dehydrogenase family protein subunit M [Acetobacteraceae bacterium]
MQRFAYRRPESVEAAIQAVSAAPGRPNTPPVRAPGQFIAGGTNMTDYMALDVMRPEILVDINRLPAARYGRMEAGAQGLRLGALVRMAQAEDHPVIKSQYPVIHDTLKLAASRQIRNMASLGGNVLQRTRCEYFRETSWACNKRQPGAGCSALDGFNRQHAILGTSPDCIAAYAGDFAQALIALDATVETMGANGGRTIKVADLHQQPGSTPNVETVLEPGELILFINVPAGPWTARSRYLKIRDRDSYQFALTAAAVALDLDGDRVREARIALGGVATIPWRAHEAEAALRGKPLDENTAAQAAQAAFANASTRQHNAFKVPLGKQTIVRALLETKAMKV